MTSSDPKELREWRKILVECGSSAEILMMIDIAIESGCEFTIESCEEDE